MSRQTKTTLVSALHISAVVQATSTSRKSLFGGDGWTCPGLPGAFFSSGKDEARHERGLGIELSLWYPTPPPLLKTVGTFSFS
jgi:hypothetical protein